MLSQAAAAAPLGFCYSYPNPYSFPKLLFFPSIKLTNYSTNTQQITTGQTGLPNFAARRRFIAYEEAEDDDDDGEYGYNEEIALLELYSLSATDEALLVQASVDDQQAELLIFKGFSSSLSYKTSADPSRSIIPARGVIKSIDRVKGPFDPSNILYLEKGLSWETFKSRINPS